MGLRVIIWDMTELRPLFQVLYYTDSAKVNIAADTPFHVSLNIQVVTTHHSMASLSAGHRRVLSGFQQCLLHQYADHQSYPFGWAQLFFPKIRVSLPECCLPGAHCLAKWYHYHPSCKPRRACVIQMKFYLISFPKVLPRFATHPP